MNQSDYDKIYPSLPPKIQEFLNSEELTVIIKNTAILARLSIQQTGRLSYIIGDVLLGKLSIKEFVIKIKSYLEITDPQVQIIKEVVIKKVFEPLKDDLNQLKINRPELTFPKIQQKETATPQKPLEVPKTETIKTEEIKELTQKAEPLPDLSLPEIQEIKIERPVNKTDELKKVSIPSVTPEQQSKIHSRLLEIIGKKESQPKVLEQMKKIISEGPKKPLPQPAKKAIQQTEELTASKVIEGEKNEFNSQEKIQKPSSRKPYILNVKLKESEEFKQEPPEKEIKYQPPTPEKPFGEA